ncbi:hypothetical protein SYNPS1DRAFT_21923 [Syncephalis pseudoplumigaleata]|uniref:Ankyrin repeat-containing domain protein n=1 Tax=Syncephalis pseudoplumigaleata TaxID=1712513 RepID=A0A4P9Z1P0_9FUNG|nr:hypothetical protein SYNPS1DRAFT_21923 [Syncephalis pseudoplumigaleata]|eukprot:RKP26276.1 hypothetical protein SYNPS1DRAFT_21923 [Syncephalis pseudoplumigaleata]
MADLPCHGEYREEASRVSLALAHLPHGMFHRRNALAETRCLHRVHIYLARGGSLADAAFVVALAAKYSWLPVIRMMFEFDQDSHELLRSPTHTAGIIGARGKMAVQRAKARRVHEEEPHGKPTTPAELALVHCAREGQEELLDLLLGYNVRPCVEALTAALERYRWPIVSKLVSAGVVPDMDTLDLMNQQMNLI